MNQMKKKARPILNLLIGILLLFVLSFCQQSEAQPEAVPEIELTGIVKTLRKEHPRLLLTDERLAELKNLGRNDATLAKYAADVIAQADKDLFKAPIEHVLIGPRLLDKSRECLNRVYNLAFAYRWTNNPKYLASAIANLKNVCSFADWNPSHFLDVAEMTHAVAIGYDWLFNSMDQPTRDQVKAGLIKLGLEEGKKAYASNAWWTKVEHNWNQVCNSGLTIGALAVAETDPQFALTIVPKAIEYLPFALKSYGPDGVWGEGPGYWSYATDYTAYGISALQTALGSDFGLTKLPGLNLTGYFPIYSAGPTGYMLNYADAGEKSKLGVPHPCFWLAGVYSNNHFSDFTIDQLKTRTANVFDVIWYKPTANSAANRPLDQFFGGNVSLYFSRSSWNDANALWIGFKAGYNKVNHAHLDLGNFELDALGVRWARDLGSDDYDLPEYFGSKRYSYYRLQSMSHNVPVLNGQNQRQDGTSQFVKHGEGIAEPYAVVDFTSAYKDFASSAQRGIKILDNRKSIVVQDEFVLTQSAEYVWGMTTDASIQIMGPKEAELTLSGQKMKARILTPSNAVFTVESARQAKPQKENTGVSRLLAKVPESVGNITFAVQLTPQWPGLVATTPVVEPLSVWK